MAEWLAGPNWVSHALLLVEFLHADITPSVVTVQLHNGAVQGGESAQQHEAATSLLMLLDKDYTPS